MLKLNLVLISCLILSSLLLIKPKPNVRSSIPVQSLPVVKTNQIVNLFKYGDTAWNSKFTRPTPPPNSRAITAIFNPHGMKYLATMDAIPADWQLFNSPDISFQYPPQYRVTPHPHQKLELTYQSLPALFIYYSSSAIQPQNEELAYFGKPDSTLVDFYGIDGREWLVTAPDNPQTATGITAQTAVKDKFINLWFRKTGETVGKNFRDEVYQILSTFKLSDQSKISDYSPKENVPNIYSLKSNPSIISNQTKFFDSQGLDYLPVQTRHLFFYENINSPGTYLFAFPAGYIAENSEVKKTGTAIRPYLETPKYCQTAGDCSYRLNICTQGFYNQYQKLFEGYGCQGNVDENGEYLDEYSPELNCVITSKYDKVDCVNNQCVGTNYRYVCNP